MTIETMTIILAVPLFLFGFVASLYFYKKSKVQATLQIQCSSGDSEVMSFNYNFTSDDTEETKSAKIDEAFTRIDHRRAFNHERYLKIKKEALEENLGKAQGNGKIHEVSQEDYAQRTPN